MPNIQYSVPIISLQNNYDLYVIFKKWSQNVYFLSAFRTYAPLFKQVSIFYLLGTLYLPYLPMLFFSKAPLVVSFL